MFILLRHKTFYNTGLQLCIHQKSDELKVILVWRFKWVIFEFCARSLKIPTMDRYTVY